ncbi:MAG: CpaF family protein, partial [Pedococcus sp.]
MSLAERLESVRRTQQAASDAASGTPTPAANERQRIADPFAAVKASVHQALLDSLGPQLYDPHL